MPYDDYSEADYLADRAAGQLDAWEHAHPANYDPLDALIGQMEADLEAHQLLYA